MPDTVLDLDWILACPAPDGYEVARGLRADVTLREPRLIALPGVDQRENGSKFAISDPLTARTFDHARYAASARGSSILNAFVSGMS